MADFLNKIKQYKEQQNAYYSILEQKIANLNSEDQEPIEGMLSILDLYKKAKVYRDTHKVYDPQSAWDEVYIHYYKFECKYDESLSSQSLELSKLCFFCEYIKTIYQDDYLKLLSLDSIEFEYAILGLKHCIYQLVCESKFTCLIEDITCYYKDIYGYYELFKNAGLFDIPKDKQGEIISELSEFEDIPLKRFWGKNMQDSLTSCGIECNDEDLEYITEISNPFLDIVSLNKGDFSTEKLIEFGKLTEAQLKAGITLNNWKSYYEGKLWDIEYSQKEKELLKPLFESPYLDALDDWKAYAKGECNLEDLLPITEPEESEDVISENDDVVIDEISNDNKSFRDIFNARTPEGRVIDHDALSNWIKNKFPKNYAIKSGWAYYFGLLYVLNMKDVLLSDYDRTKFRLFINNITNIK